MPHCILVVAYLITLVPQCVGCWRRLASVSWTLVISHIFYVELYLENINHSQAQTLMWNLEKRGMVGDLILQNPEDQVPTLERQFPYQEWLLYHTKSPVSGRRLLNLGLPLWLEKKSNWLNLPLKTYKYSLCQHPRIDYYHSIPVVCANIGWISVLVDIVFRASTYSPESERSSTRAPEEYTAWSTIRNLLVRIWQRWLLLRNQGQSGKH